MIIWAAQCPGSILVNEGLLSFLVKNKYRHEFAAPIFPVLPGFASRFWYCFLFIYSGNVGSNLIFLKRLYVPNHVLTEDYNGIFCIPKGTTLEFGPSSWIYRTMYITYFCTQIPGQKLLAKFSDTSRGFPISFPPSEVSGNLNRNAWSNGKSS